MKRELKPEERLIVAADFKPILRQGARNEVRKRVLDLATSLMGTGVYLKVNSALRACGYDLADEIHALGLRVFGDLKLIDINETLSTDGVLLKEAKLELLTVMCVAGGASMQALKAELPDTEVLGVTVLTSLNEDDSQALFGRSINEAVFAFADAAAIAGLNGLISSAGEVPMLRKEFGDRFTLNTPAIRPTWAIVPGDDQNPDRIMTPAKAIKAGADRIVVGRPIVKAEDPYAAVMRTLEEIASAL